MWTTVYAIVFLAHTRKADQPPVSTRELIVQALAAEPGMRLTKLQTQLALSWGTLYYHLGVMTAEGQVRIVPVGRQRLAFLKDAPCNESDAAARAFLDDPTAARVAKAILASPDSSVEALAQRTGQSRRATYYHVRQLLQAGILSSTSGTRHFGLRVEYRHRAYVRDLPDPKAATRSPPE